MKLTFYGAAENVTGSKYLLEAAGRRLLVDCGMFQERQLSGRNWDPFPFNPAGLDAVLLTHAHIDHCGLLPRLVRDGFQGPVYCTPATADIARLILLDSAKIQEEDAAFKRRRHEKEGRGHLPPPAVLYTAADVEAAVRLFRPVDCGQAVEVGGVSISFHEAGHVLGSTWIRVRAGTNGSTRTIVFSGDLGRRNTPILRDPEMPADADHVLVESTYGNRDHKPSDAIPELLATIITETRAAGGNVVIPSFALERTQELLYHLSGLLRARRIPRPYVFVDSPMAVRLTEVFQRHPELFDDETRSLLRRGEHPCDFPGLRMTQSVEQSKAINEVRRGAVIIAGAGMCTGGRIKHHLVANISRPESTILFVGYQANGTLGRAILEGAREVRIHGQPRVVAARIAKINGFSAHGDRNELLGWLSGLQSSPRQTFVVHGEPEASRAFADLLHEKKGWSASVPAYQSSVELA